MKGRKGSTSPDFQHRGTVYANKRLRRWQLIMYTYTKDGKRDYSKNKVVTTEITAKFHDNGKPMNTGRKEAEQQLAEYLEKNINAGLPIVSFRDISAKWLDFMVSSDAIRSNTAYGYKSQLNVISKYFEENDLSMNRIGKKEINDYVDHLRTVKTRTQKNLSTNTQKKYLLLVSQVFEYAYRKEYIASNPTADMEMPRVKKKIIVNTLSLSEAHRLIEVSRDTEIAAPVFLALNFGLRRSEACGLKWSAVNIAGKNLHVKSTIVYEGGKPIESIPKTEKSDRIIPIGDDQLDFFIKLKKQQEKDKDYYGNTYDDNDYICRYQDGKVMKPEYVSKHFAKLLKKNGFTPLRFHDLRHSFASLYMNEAGGNIKILQELLGHGQIETTSAIYTHIDNTPKQQAINNMSRLLNQRADTASDETAG